MLLFVAPPSCVNAGVRNSSSSPSTIRAEACFFMWRTACCACWPGRACRKKHAAPTSIRRKISGCPFTPRWDRCWACPLPTATGDTRPSPPAYPREYTSCYLACRRHGVDDLLTLLRNLPPGGAKRTA